MQLLSDCSMSCMIAIGASEYMQTYLQKSSKVLCCPCVSRLSHQARKVYKYDLEDLKSGAKP